MRQYSANASQKCATWNVKTQKAFVLGALVHNSEFMHGNILNGATVDALYVIQYGCLPVLNLRLRPAHTSIEQLRELFCSNNFYEVSEMVARTRATIPTALQDLFMEQGQWLTWL